MNTDIVRSIYSNCTLCPRVCQVNRYERAGFCGAGTKIKLARAALHLWEEPCLSGSAGSGAVFFSNCTLKCIFCQNSDISSGGFGKEISVDRLSDIFLELQDKGAANIDLITGTHYVPSIIAALDKVKHRIMIPVVFNCGGYESLDTLRLLDGYIDIYLPDLKYYDDETAVRLSAAPGYFAAALGAIGEMIRQTGSPVFSADNDDGLLKKGVIIRHMVIPGMRKDSISLLDRLAETISTDRYIISLMSQYTPFYKAKDIPGINRRITSFEYDSVVDHAFKLGMKGFMQERSSAKEEYTPPFDLEGV
ncbi:MAG: radical SAM protein [Eubacteriales bacterium]|nr:radical SAM protein [Eubacteriales bacterium]